VCVRISDIARLFETSASTTLEPSFLAVHTIVTANCGTQKLVCSYVGVDESLLAIIIGLMPWFGAFSLLVGL